MRLDESGQADEGELRGVRNDDGSSWPRARVDRFGVELELGGTE
jgi:hypothetical protein